MQLDTIIKQQNTFIKEREEVMNLIRGYKELVERWEYIEEQIKEKWLTNLENAFKHLFKNKGFDISENNEFKRRIEAKLGCCVFFMCIDKEGKGLVSFGVFNPEIPEKDGVEKSVNDIRYKILLEGPINKYKDIQLGEKNYGLLTACEIYELLQILPNLTCTLRELKTIKAYIEHNKRAQEHYINNQNKLKLITTSTQFGVFHTLEELIERM